MKNKKKLILLIFLFVVILLVLTYELLTYRHGLIENVQTSSIIKEMQYKHENLAIGKIENIVTSKYEEKKQEKVETPKQENKTEETNVKENNIEVPKQTVTATKIVYGKSVQGRDLEAYIIKGLGNNSKTIFLDFEVHRI